MPNPLNDLEKFREAFDPMSLTSDTEFSNLSEMERLNIGIDAGVSGYFEVKRSVRQDEIVHIGYTDELFQNLKELSENYTDCNEGYDLWGTVDDQPWRIILDGKEA